MPKYVIERDIPGAGSLTAAQLAGAAQKSNCVLQAIGPKVQWLESFVTDDKLYCIYIADSEETVLKHANESGFIAKRVSVVKNIIGPQTAEMA